MLYVNNVRLALSKEADRYKFSRKSSFHGRAKRSMEKAIFALIGRRTDPILSNLIAPMRNAFIGLAIKASFLLV